MGLRNKFNLMMLLAFIVALTLAGYLSFRVLKDNARAEVLKEASILMEGALAIRGYTSKEIYPLLEGRLDEEWLPQTVSAYAAAQNLSALREKFPDYLYKEATLNPTKLSDRATDWEADIIHGFRADEEHKELSLVRDTVGGQVLHLARPLQIKSESCLKCHSTPADAPASMIEVYGDKNGFGWELGEIVGAQIVSVPMTVPLERAKKIFMTNMSALVGVFVVLFIVLNVFLNIVILKPVERMSQIAEEVSLGKMDSPEYVKKGRDEVASLSRSFNRMRRSLQNALKMLDE